jgi:hypothetical protein
MPIRTVVDANLGGSPVVMAIARPEVRAMDTSAVFARRKSASAG